MLDDDLFDGVVLAELSRRLGDRGGLPEEESMVFTGVIAQLGRKHWAITRYPDGAIRLSRKVSLRCATESVPGR